MLITDIKPYVRFSRIQNDYPVKKTLIAPDHRMFCCIKGKGKIILNKKEYQIKNNTLIYWPSGTSYSFIPDTEHPMTTIGVNFDFFYNQITETKYVYPFKEYEFQGNVIENIQFDDITIFNDILSIENFTEVIDIFMKINDLFIAKKYFYEYRCSALLMELIFNIAQKHEDPQHIKKVRKIEPILDYIHQNHNQRISNLQIAEKFGYHPSYVNKLMIKHVGATLHQYLVNYRITKAIYLLQTTDMSITEISDSLGFYDIKHFSKSFYQHTGLTPSKFRLL